MPQVPTGIPTGIGSLFSKDVVQALAAGVRFVLPAGTFYVYVVGATAQLQIIDSTGVWNNITAAGVIPLGALVADGASLGFFSAAASSITYIRLST